MLNYIGSVDVQSATTGSTLYNIVFDPNLCLLGNILMFEYKIQSFDVEPVIPDPTSIFLGYVNIEHAIFNSGIANQWTISVPSQNNEYNSANKQEISVRVYSGLTGSTEIVVTSWSNSLEIHVSPAQPVLVSAYFADSVYSEDDLWINMRSDVNYNYTDINFIVAYYFQNETNETIWAVSNPLLATNIQYGGNNLQQLSVPNIGNINSYATDKAVYVAVYAVYSFKYDYRMYYSVSEVSSTIKALPAGDFNNPKITTITYGVYSINSPAFRGPQIMTVEWLAPENTSIPSSSFVVLRYVLQISTDLTSWTNVDDNITPGTESGLTSYNVDVSTYLCGDTISFRVYAITGNDVESSFSNVKSMNKFISSDEPTSFSVIDSSIDVNENISKIKLSFNNPTDIGCGVGKQFVIKFTDRDGNFDTKYVDYTAGTSAYEKEFADLYLSSEGIIEVYLETYDTNGDPIPRVGISKTIPYISANLILDPVVYKVYDHPYTSQDMVLTWSGLSTLKNWHVASYDVYLDKAKIATVINGQTYTYTATEACTSVLNFMIKANVTNSSTKYIIVSNEESINIFKFAAAPSLVIVNWATPDPSSTIVDLAVTFTVPSPYDNGCGKINNWVVNVKNVAGTVISTQAVDYVSGQTDYHIYINDVTYIHTGNVVVYMTTTDTNSSDVLNGFSQEGGFISLNLPIIKNVILNTNSLKFDVFTEGILSYIGRFIWHVPTPFSTTYDLPFKTNNSPAVAGETVVVTLLDKKVNQYSYTFTPEFFSTQEIPYPLGFAVANSVGVSAKIALLSV
jgi:predicted small secreted protein